MSVLPRVCVIGAGSSGIAAAKALHEAGVPFDSFEKSDTVGGNWVFGNKNKMSSAYRSLHINTSRERMEYSDYPMPKSYPDFPHHTHIAEYFGSYVDHFGFRGKIRFNTGVERCVRRDDGVWEVTLEGGETLEYDALMVANGHHWNPRWPEPPFPGKFNGVEMHSHYYIDNKDLVGKNVVVLGMGNSAMDIACEASHVASKVYLAARRGAYVIPKYLFGKPLDQIGAMSPRVPFEIRRRILEGILKTQVGSMENYGLPKPDHRLGEAHPTVSSEILIRIGSGDVTPKPNIAALRGDEVRFADGSVEPVDVIIYCTGYKVTFPFFDEDFLSARENDLPLFRRVFKPDIGNVFFIGLLQPLGAIMPLAELQSAWVVDYLQGDYALPSRADMETDMQKERAAMFKRYVASKRHTMQVDFDDYVLWVAHERKRGRRRAMAQSFARPVPALAGEPKPVASTRRKAATARKAAAAS